MSSGGWEKVTKKQRKKKTRNEEEPAIYDHETAGSEQTSLTHVSHFASLDDDGSIEDLHKPARVVQEKKKKPPAVTAVKTSKSKKKAKNASHQVKQEAHESKEPTVITPDMLNKFITATESKYKDVGIQLQIVANYVTDKIDGLIVPQVQPSADNIEGYWAWPLSTVSTAQRKILESWFRKKDKSLKCSLIVPLIKHLGVKDTVGGRVLLQILCRGDAKILSDDQYLSVSDTPLSIAMWVTGQVVSGLHLWSHLVGTDCILNHSEQRDYALSCLIGLLGRHGDGTLISVNTLEILLKLINGDPVQPQQTKKGPPPSREQKRRDAQYMVGLRERLSAALNDLIHVTVHRNCMMYIDLVLDRCDADDAACEMCYTAILTNPQDSVEKWIEKVENGQYIKSLSAHCASKFREIDRDTAIRLLHPIQDLCDVLDDVTLIDIVKSMAKGQSWVWMVVLLTAMASGIGYMLYNR